MERILSKDQIYDFQAPQIKTWDLSDLTALEKKNQNLLTDHFSKTNENSASLKSCEEKDLYISIVIL